MHAAGQVAGNAGRMAGLGRRIVMYVRTNDFRNGIQKMKNVGSV
jgi:hypothetical protein